MDRRVLLEMLNVYEKHLATYRQNYQNALSVSTMFFFFGTVLFLIKTVYFSAYLYIAFSISLAIGLAFVPSIFINYKRIKYIEKKYFDIVYLLGR